MHDNTVSSDVSKAGETSVRTPVVCLDLTARQKTLIYDGPKGNGVSPINYYEIPSGWTVLGRDDAKYPCITGRPPSPVVLTKKNKEKVIMLTRMVSIEPRYNTTYWRWNLYQFTDLPFGFIIKTMREFIALSSMSRGRGESYTTL